MSDQIIKPTPDEISLAWEKARQDKTLTLWVEAWIPANANDKEPRTAQGWEHIRKTDTKGNVVPGFVAVAGPVIGKGSRLSIYDKSDNTLKEDVHPHWVYSIEMREVTA